MINAIVAHVTKATSMLATKSTRNSVVRDIFLIDDGKAGLDDGVERGVAFDLPTHLHFFSLGSASMPLCSVVASMSESCATRTGCIIELYRRATLEKKLCFCLCPSFDGVRYL